MMYVLVANLLTMMWIIVPIMIYLMKYMLDLMHDRDIEW